MDKIFYYPGDVVTLKQEIPYKPIMIVIKRKTSHFKPVKPFKIEGVDEKNFTDDPYFIGMECMWFTKDGLIQKEIFSTKDLVKVDK